MSHAQYITHHEVILSLQSLQFSLQLLHLRSQMLVVADYGLGSHQQPSRSQRGDAQLQNISKRYSIKDLTTHSMEKFAVC